MVAYRAGFTEGRLTIPLRFIRSLGEHRVGCEGETAAQVVGDLGAELHLPREEIRRLLDTLPNLEQRLEQREEERPKLRPAS